MALGPAARDLVPRLQPDPTHHPPSVSTPRTVLLTVMAGPLCRPSTQADAAALTAHGLGSWTFASPAIAPPRRVPSARRGCTSARPRPARTVFTLYEVRVGDVRICPRHPPRRPRPPLAAPRPSHASPSVMAGLVPAIRCGTAPSRKPLATPPSWCIGLLRVLSKTPWRGPVAAARRSAPAAHRSHVIRG